MNPEHLFPDHPFPDQLLAEEAGDLQPGPVVAEPAAHTPVSVPPVSAPAFSEALPASEPEGGSFAAEPKLSGWAELYRRLDQLESQVRMNRIKDEQIVRLHAELQQFRSGEAERRLDPLLLAIIRLHDHVGRTVAIFREKSPEELSAEKVLKQLAGVEEDIELLLGHYEVSPFREEGDTLIPQRQLASRVETAVDPAAVGRIAARLRPGFLLRERVLVKERVAVFALPKSTG